MTVPGIGPAGLEAATEVLLTVLGSSGSESVNTTGRSSGTRAVPSGETEETNGAVTWIAMSTVAVAPGVWLGTGLSPALPVSTRSERTVVPTAGTGSA